jgi:hypothetical protein
MITPELLEAYKATCYEIINPKIEIFIDKENKALFNFLSENTISSWCFITAWNPYSKELSMNENMDLNNQLEKELKDYKIYAAQGKGTIGDWPPEPSFFVTNITEVDAIALGKKYKQNAIVYGNYDGHAKLITLVAIES